MKKVPNAPKTPRLHARIWDSQAPRFTALFKAARAILSDRGVLFPIHPTNPYRRDRCGVSETTASVSSSFRSVREGMGDFGIAFLPGGERFGKLGR
jgi:hypothetical protein